MRWSVRRAARRAWRGVITFFLDGFGALAMMFGMVPPSTVAQAKDWWLGDADPEGPRHLLPLDEPPLAHPERLATHVPPSPGERELWAQLEGHGRVEDGPGRRE